MNKINIEKSLTDYIELLSKTIIQEYVSNNKLLYNKIIVHLLGYSSDEYIESIKKYILPNNLISFSSPEDLIKSSKALIDETNISNLKLLSINEEKEYLKKSGVSSNSIFNKMESREFLYTLNNKYKELIVGELADYNKEDLLNLFYLMGDSLAWITHSVLLKIDDNTPLKYSEDHPLSAVFNSIKYMTKNELMKIQQMLGIEKAIIDILFNIIYIEYFNENEQINEAQGQVIELNIAKIYQYGYMIFHSNLLLKSNELLYEIGEVIKIKDGLLNHSGEFFDAMKNIQEDIWNFRYKENVLDTVFSEYSKREGFSPNDLFEFAFKSGLDRKAHFHIKVFDVQKLKSEVFKITNIKEYGIDRFFDVISLDKDIKDIYSSTNKVSVRPLIRLKNEKIMYSEILLFQSAVILQSRMLQQSFTKNKKMQKFISKNYDEIGIKSISDNLKKKDLQIKEHVCIDRINNIKIKEKLSFKGITKEFDLIVLKGRTLYIIEYKTWKISSHSLMLILNEYKKILKSIECHNKAINIIKNNIEEFKLFFGEDFSDFNEIELIMVFQNPTCVKYLDNIIKARILSPEELIKFIVEN